MRAFYVLVVCTFAAAVISSCESKEHQAGVTGFNNVHRTPPSAWKTVKDNKVKVSAINSEVEWSKSRSRSNVNQEEIVQHENIGAEQSRSRSGSRSRSRSKVNQEEIVQHENIAAEQSRSRSGSRSRSRSNVNQEEIVQHENIGAEQSRSRSRSRSKVNQEEIVQRAKIAAERAKTYPKSLKEWEERIQRKMKAKKAGEKKITPPAEVASPKLTLRIMWIEKKWKSMQLVRFPA